jgi:hypothetical protein
MRSDLELWRQVAEMHEAVELAPWLGDPQAEAEIEAAEQALAAARGRA